MRALNVKNKTIPIGPTGFLGPAFLEADPSIVAVGRALLPANLSNEFVKIGSDLDFSPLDDVNFDHVIFLIGGRIMQYLTLIQQWLLRKMLYRCHVF